MNEPDAGGAEWHPPDADAPFLPPEVDLGSFLWLPVYLDFFLSCAQALMESAEPFRALVLLVANSRRERPAMSVPDNDLRLAQMAGFARNVDAWLAIRPQVLIDWIPGPGQRLYHPEFSKWGRQAWESKKRTQRFSELQRERALVGVARRQAGNKGTGDLSRGSAAVQPIKKVEETERKVDKEERKGEPPSAACEVFAGSLQVRRDLTETVGIKEVIQMGDGEGEVIQVFEHWKSRTHRPSETLTKSRRDIIRARLDEGVSSGEMLRAIDAAATSDFYQGRTEKQPHRLDTLDVIFRNKDRIVRLAGEPATNMLKPAAHKTAERIKSVMERLQLEAADPDTQSAGSEGAP